MTEQNGTGKNVFDVIFSLEKHHFPVQRNYHREPRGSLNPINSQDTSDVCQITLKSLRDKFSDPCKLYAIDFKMNYLVRQLADFLLYADKGDERAAYFSEFDVQAKYVDIINKAGEMYGILSGIPTVDVDSIDLPLPSRDETVRILYSTLCYKNLGFLGYAMIVKALQHIIETSTWDWKTKAEGFLRATSGKGFSPADDETIIYLMSQDLKDPELEKEAQHRWKRYRKEWKDLFFTDINPFDDKFSIDRLRLIHWDALGKLRWLEGQLPDEQRNTYEYNIQCQHLLSPSFLNDFTRAFSLFRTDLNTDPIRSQVENIVNRFYGFISGNHLFEYNYTVTDVYHLADLLFSFASGRIPYMSISEDKESSFRYKSRNAIEFNNSDSTTKFLQKIPMVTLIALEVHAVYYSQPRGFLDFLQKAKDWLLNQQTAYGYWYDGVNSPEYTTVLVLDALNLITGNDGLSFPMKANIVLPSKEMGRTRKPILFVNDLSRTLMLGREIITFKFRGGKNKTWDFILELIDHRNENLPMPMKSRGRDWKNQYDTLRRLLGDRKIIKQFIISAGDTYELQNNVHVHSHSQIWAKPGRDPVPDVQFDYRKKMVGDPDNESDDD